MAKAKKFHVVSFEGGQPLWQTFDGENLIPAGDVRPKLPVVALLPEKYFFHVLPRGLAGRSERALKAGARLQLAHMFPAKAASMEVLRPASGKVLGMFASRELESFRAGHEDILKKASVITTGFSMAWNTAMREDKPWVWTGQSGHRAAYSSGTLAYLPGGREELDSRLADMEGMDQPASYDLQSTCREIAASGMNLSLLRIPLSILESDEERDFSPIFRAAIALTLIAIFAVTGQYMRSRAKHAEADKWKQAQKILYASALGKNFGSDPYGKLLFKLDQMKSSSSVGVDLPELLAFMSTQAPPSLRIESLNVNMDNGIIRAKIGSYAELENYLSSLEGSGRYRFTLNEATNTDKGVDFSLRLDREG